MTLSNQTSRCICKCFRIVVYRFYCMKLYHSQTRRHVINEFTKSALSVLDLQIWLFVANVIYENKNVLFVASLFAGKL